MGHLKKSSPTGAGHLLKTSGGHLTTACAASPPACSDVDVTISGVDASICNTTCWVEPNGYPNRSHKVVSYSGAIDGTYTISSWFALTDYCIGSVSVGESVTVDQWFADTNCAGFKVSPTYSLTLLVSIWYPSVTIKTVDIYAYDSTLGLYYHPYYLNSTSAPGDAFGSPHANSMTCGTTLTAGTFHWPASDGGTAQVDLA